MVGFEGIAFTVTVKIFAVDEPHTLFAVTEMLPPAAPAGVVIEVVVDVPVQPPGNVHV